MNSEDFLSLIDLLTKELQQSGAGEIANPQYYVQYNPETGETRLLPPRQRLIDMLSAFERFMAVRDRATLQSSLARINALGIEGRVVAVNVLLTSGEGEGEVVNLVKAPDLSEIRAQVRQLIRQLQVDEAER